MSPPARKPQHWNDFIRWFKKVDGTTAYRLAMFFIILSVTPFAVFLPPVQGFKPLWSVVQDFDNSTSEIKGKLDRQFTKLDQIEAQANLLESKVQSIEVKVQNVETEMLKTRALVTGFQVDFERYRKTQPNQPEGKPKP